MRYPTLTASGGATIRLVDQTPERRDGTHWRKMTRRELLAFPKDGPEWAWLREHGVRRPSPPSRTGGGSKGALPADRRARGLVQFGGWVRPEQLAAMDALATHWGCSRTEAIVRAVEAAAKRAR